MARRAKRLNEFELITTDIAARQEGQPKKSFHAQDLRNIKPLNDNQRDAFYHWAAGSNLLLTGCAGTGKTTLALYLALNEVLTPDKQKQVIIIRSAVPTREIGFLPGIESEKEAPYELPYIGVCDDLFPWKNSYENLKLCKKIEFKTTSYLRGLTFDDKIIIVDEMQSMTLHEIDTVITRAGINTRMILCGDLNQNDLIYKKSDKSGFIDAVRLLNEMKSFETINFIPDDIVRGGICKEWVTQRFHQHI